MTRARKLFEERLGLADTLEGQQSESPQRCSLGGAFVVLSVNLFSSPANSARCIKVSGDIQQRSKQTIHAAQVHSHSFEDWS